MRASAPQLLCCHVRRHHVISAGRQPQHVEGQAPAHSQLSQDRRHLAAYEHAEHAGGVVLATRQHVVAVGADRQVLHRVLVPPPQPHAGARPSVPAPHRAVEAAAEDQGLAGVLRQPRQTLCGGIACAWSACVQRACTRAAAGPSPHPHLWVAAGGARGNHGGAQVPAYEVAVHAAAHGHIWDVAREAHRLHAAVLRMPRQAAHHTPIAQVDHLGSRQGGRCADEDRHR